MNDPTLTSLKTIVERAVRPVRASLSRKRKMREELLAHVSCVFAEEAERLGDDRAALARTALRFGNSADVTKDLQDSVPAGDAILRFWEGRPDESVLRGALRLACVFEAFVLFVCSVVVLVASWENPWSGAELLAVLSRLDFLPQMSFGPVCVFGIAFVAHWLEPALHAPEPLTGWPQVGLRTWLPSAWSVLAVRVALIVGSLCFCLFLCVCAAHRSSEPADWDRWTLIAAGVLLAGDLAATSVLAAWVLVQSADERRRCHLEWANLLIELPS